MPTILQLRRGTSAENAAYTGAAGEITVDTTLIRYYYTMVLLQVVPLQLVTYKEILD